MHALCPRSVVHPFYSNLCKERRGLIPGPRRRSQRREEEEDEEEEEEDEEEEVDGRSGREVRISHKAEGNEETGDEFKERSPSKDTAQQWQEPPCPITRGRNLMKYDISHV
ncbi:histone chaperone ASF1-like [Alosa sapidissima]|uniref:histone chaperone ASF1-like n=1 Tax=Alosa sapidissima TaxID=34773 RepID=UPI001C09947E|nr:histone chaperone ASF1-like [Alosa sapidissima]